MATSLAMQTSTPDGPDGETGESAALQAPDSNPHRPGDQERKHEL